MFLYLCICTHVYVHAYVSRQCVSMWVCGNVGRCRCRLVMKLREWRLCGFHMGAMLNLCMLYVLVCIMSWAPEWYRAIGGSGILQNDRWHHDRVFHRGQQGEEGGDTYSPNLGF